DETLVVGNDRKMSVKGKQEQTTTGDHVSLVKGMKSLEVKGDLAQKINLNGGGSAGTPVGVMQPGALEALADDDADDVDDNRTGNDDNSDDNEDNQDNTDKYYLQFHFTDDDGIPYANTEYIAYFSSGMQKKGLTNKEGNTERFISNAMDSVEVKLTLDFQNN
ncbi:type VI secretion system tip protein VgrG, partial [Citrobacter sp. Cf136]|nr:type VI secretion system tip protein VgrG [Citrobacter sp. Cf136]